MALVRVLEQLYGRVIAAIEQQFSVEEIRQSVIPWLEKRTEKPPERISGVPDLSYVTNRLRKYCDPAFEFAEFDRQAELSRRFNRGKSRMEVPPEQ